MNWPFHISRLRISFTENDINICMSKALTTIDKLSILSKFNLSGEIKPDSSKL